MLSLSFTPVCTLLLPSSISSPKPHRFFNNFPNPTPRYPRTTTPQKLPLIPRTIAPPFAISGDAGLLAGGEDDEEEKERGSPWEGAVVYRRDAAAAHVEYCTSLERLGLGRLSSPASRARAAAMGIRAPVRRAVKAQPSGEETPVLVSVGVARRRRRLRLDGIVRTVLSLGCYRCGEPAAECVFSNFSILLSEDPIEEPAEIDMGMIFGEDRAEGPFGSSNEEDNDDEQIDWDNRLYFPAEQKEIDISKHIRDIVHVEITLNPICSSSCRGLCLKCGTNLNKSSCNCSRKREQGKDSRGGFGPLKGLAAETNATKMTQIQH